KLIGEFSDKYKDIGSSDFVTGLLKQHEKLAWMLRAYLG
ncbi:MAG: DNA starvation/stationary phase protection protein, partial [Bacteroidetes bacterium]|nr:DNA starvation/stationary phase protection protein [Bacteroidota bacterium]